VAPALELLRKGGSRTGGPLRLLERLVQLRQLGLQRGTAILGPTVEFVHFGVEPAAIAAGDLLDQGVAANPQGLI